MLEILARAVKQKKEIQEALIGKEVKISLYAYDMILYLRDAKNSTRRLEMINTFSRVAGYKINLQKSVAFLFINDKQVEKEYMETLPFKITSKNILGYSWLKTLKNSSIKI